MHKDRPLPKIQNNVIVEQRQNTSTPVDSPHATTDSQLLFYYYFIFMEKQWIDWLLC